MKMNVRRNVYSYVTSYASNPIPEDFLFHIDHNINLFMLGTLDS
jgi:hypothetical protein